VRRLCDTSKRRPSHAGPAAHIRRDCSPEHIISALIWTRSWLRSSATRALVALALGLAVGAAIASSGSPAARSFASALEPLGTLWVNGIRMTIVPLVASLLIATLASTDGGKAVGQLGLRALALFVAVLIGVSIVGVIGAPPLMGRLEIDPASSASLRATASSAPPPELPSFASWVVGLVPANPIKAAADGAMLPVIVFAVVFALGLARVAPSLRVTTATFFRALADAMLVIVQWVLALAPIGVFALAVTLATHLGGSVAGAVGYFILVHCALLTVVGAMLYLVVRLGAGVPVGRFARAALPAQIVALSTRSSVAALPAMIDGAERVLRIPPEIAGFALPFGVSLLRANTAVSWIVSAIFVAKLYGVPFGATGIAVFAGATVLMSFSVPGIPSGGLFILAPLFVTVGLPVEGIGILIALDAIPDIFKTGVNVTAHLTVTTLLARRLTTFHERAPIQE